MVEDFATESLIQSEAAILIFKLADFLVGACFLLVRLLVADRNFLKVSMRLSLFLENERVCKKFCNEMLLTFSNQTEPRQQKAFYWAN
jgi:hypothetical protein